MLSMSTRLCLIAWEFLTIVRLPGSTAAPVSAELAASMSCFPLVGLILGAVLVATDILTSLVFPPTIVNLLLIIVLIIITGGLHIDGLADTLDGLAGGSTRADRLRIMRDVHLGALGAAGLVLSLGLQYAALLALPDSLRLAALACMPMLGRWAMVIASFRMPYARAEGGLAQPFLHTLSINQVIIATAFAAFALIVSLGILRATVVLVVIALVSRGASALASRLLGGMTGDVLGATNQAAEIIFLLVIPVLTSNLSLLAL
jgi:adenosylcobinamide-GDP ribazoletransferase